MKDIVYEILSEIHRLLSIASEEQLQCASKLPNTSSHIRAALIALAAEKASTRRQIGMETMQRSKPQRTKVSSAQNAKTGLNAGAREIAKALEKLSKAEIQKALQSVGLALPMRAKDARNKVVQRAIKMILALSDDERNRAFTALHIDVDSQTEGWVGVIRKG